MEFIVYEPFEYATPGGLPDQTSRSVIVKRKSRSWAAVGLQAIEGPAHLVPAHVRSKPTLWNVNNHVDLETYWYIY